MILPLATAGLSAPVARWAVIALVGVALFVTGYSHGRHVAAGDAARAQLDTALAYAGEIVRNQGEAERLAAENTALRAAQAPRDRIIAQEIVRYVQVTPPVLRCTLPGTWRLRHDAAATGLPGAAGAGSVADGLAEPVDDAAALETVGANYEACRAAIARLEGWQRRQRALDALTAK